MATKPKRKSIAEALKQQDDVRAFLKEGRATNSKQRIQSASQNSQSQPELRIAITVRLPERIVHALIDASAERRKNREKKWSQQDIVSEALRSWLKIKLG